MRRKRIMRRSMRRITGAGRKSLRRRSPCSRKPPHAPSRMPRSPAGSARRRWSAGILRRCRSSRGTGGRPRRPQDVPRRSSPPQGPRCREGRKRRRLKPRPGLRSRGSPQHVLPNRRKRRTASPTRTWPPTMRRRGARDRTSTWFPESPDSRARSRATPIFWTSRRSTTSFLPRAC